jgi:hypothetical protein
MYWKFLNHGRVSPFSGYVWQVGTWAQADKPQHCYSGFHGCRADDLPYWLNDELWLLEFRPPVVEMERKVVAVGARLVRPVDGWTAATRHELAMACTERTVRHAAAELASVGLASGAARLTDAASVRDVPTWVAAARVAADEAAERGERQSLKLCGYVLDAVDALQNYPVASTAYIAARAANQRTSTDAPDPYVAERSWQARWLVDRLQLQTS